MQLELGKYCIYDSKKREKISRVRI